MRAYKKKSLVTESCLIEGLSFTELWFCEGRELENSPDIRISQDGDLCTLAIAEAFEDDTGRYSCTATNCFGSDTTSAEVYIEGRHWTNRLQDPAEAIPKTIPIADPREGEAVPKTIPSADPREGEAVPKTIPIADPRGEKPS
eukprot:g37800.t1